MSFVDLIQSTKDFIQIEQSILLSDGFIPNIITIKRLSLLFVVHVHMHLLVLFQLLDLPIARITLPPEFTKH